MSDETVRVRRSDMLRGRPGLVPVGEVGQIPTRRPAATGQLRCAGEAA
jgi:hypothetical protein